MSDDKYTEALQEAQAELARLDERRQSLIRLISNLKALCGYDELTPPPDYIPKGLTEEIRTILNLTTVPLDAMQIRDSMLNRGFENSNPKNLLISVHTVLKRIEGELQKSERDGKPAYIAKVRTFDPAYMAGIGHFERKVAQRQQGALGETIRKRMEQEKKK